MTRFVLREPGHTRAIQTAWNLLAERGLTGTTLPLPEPPVAAHLCAGEAAGIVNRLEMLGRLQQRLKHSPPHRLIARLAVVEIWHDSWATRELQEAGEAAIEKLAAESRDWLASIPPVKPLALADRPVVLVLDAIPPDAWLAIAEEPGPLLSAGQTTWHRLETSARTVPSLNALFGFDTKREPMEEFAAHGVAYHRLEGTERDGLADRLANLDPTAPVVLHLAAADRDFHAGQSRLHDLPAKLKNLLERHLPGLREFARAHPRRLIVTTDHGIFFTRKGLSHGGGGVFEQAVFRWEVAPPAAVLPSPASRSRKISRS